MKPAKPASEPIKSQPMKPAKPASEPIKSQPMKPAKPATSEPMKPQASQPEKNEMSEGLNIDLIDFEELDKIKERNKLDEMFLNIKSLNKTN